MNYKFLNGKNKKFYLSLTLSVFTHVCIFFILVYLLGLKINKPVINPVYINFSNSLSHSQDEDEITKNETEDFEKSNQSKELIESETEQINNTSLNYHLFNDLEADTSNLQQTYFEPTLKVSIKYPAGWTFIDQNVKNKLDGVTFWMFNSEIKPPPYLHLEVIEKYLFNPTKFEDSLQISDFIVFYSDPEELEGQITQLFYIRTEIEEDFSLKLIVKGWDNYRNFQPKLLGMLKTFDFKHSLL